MQYSSKDFNRTKSKLETTIPKPLIHKNVVTSQENNEFSTERGHAVAIVELPSKTLSMTIGGLKPLEKTRRHRHNYETIIYIVEGSGCSVIEGKKILWQAGDALYIPVWSWHQHINSNPNQSASYVACENAPLLQNLGNIALREEGEE